MYYSTSIPALIVDIKIKEQKDGKIKAIGVGINCDSGEVYAELSAATSKPMSRKRRELAINSVISKLEGQYMDVFGHAPAEIVDLENAFQHIKAAVYEHDMKLSPGWKSESTNKQALKHFERNSLELLFPFVGPNSRLFLDSDRDEIEQKTIAICTRSNGGNEETAKEAARRYLREADIIYNHMRDYDERLPELKFSSDAPFSRTPKEEQIKDLPRPLLMALYSRLSKLVEEEPYKVFFTIFVIFGLRPAEAAGRKPSDLIWYDTFCTAEISSQERNGALDHHLKNKYSRRIVVLSWWGVCLLKKCCQIIGEDYPHDNRAMNIAVECSAWVKNLLLEIGISQEFIDEVWATVSTDDYDPGDEKSDANTKLILREKIACYILRRVFSTIMRSEMGFTLYETDRLLGHVPVGANGKKETKLDNLDLNSLETQRTIAEKMERYIFDPEYSLNPACAPIDVSKEGEVDLREFSEYCLVNNSDRPVTRRLNLEAAETGESIIVEMPKGTKCNLQTNSIPKSWADRDRTVIGDTSLSGSKKGAK